MKQLIILVIALSCSTTVWAANAHVIAIGGVRGESLALDDNAVAHIGDLMVDRCVAAGLRCVERQDLMAIREEQQLVELGLANRTHRARKGNVQSADILVSCALTGTTPNAGSVGVGVGSEILRQIGVYGVGVKTDRVSLTCRGYDTTTSEILVSTTGKRSIVTAEIGAAHASGSATKAVQKMLDDFFVQLKNKIAS